MQRKNENGEITSRVKKGWQDRRMVKTTAHPSLKMKSQDRKSMKDRFIALTTMELQAMSRMSRFFNAVWGLGLPEIRQVAKEMSQKISLVQLCPVTHLTTFPTQRQTYFKTSLPR